MHIDAQGGEQGVLLIQGDLDPRPGGQGEEIETADLRATQIGAGQLGVGGDRTEEIGVAQVRPLEIGA